VVGRPPIDDQTSQAGPVVGLDALDRFVEYDFEALYSSRAPTAFRFARFLDDQAHPRRDGYPVGNLFRRGFW